MKFTIDNQPATFATKPPQLQRLEETIAALPDGRLVSYTQLAVIAKIALNSVQRQGCLISKELSVIQGHKKFYGNKKTIQAFKAAYHL